MKTVKMIKLEDGSWVPEECCTFGRNFETNEMEMDDVSLPCGCDCSAGGTFEDPCKNCVIQQIMNEYAEIKEDDWIPCSKKMPKEDGRYLVTFKHDTEVYLVGYGTCQRTVFRHPIGHGWYNLQTADYYAEDSIIAWRPLPEPYKENDNE